MGVRDLRPEKDQGHVLLRNFAGVNNLLEADRLGTDKLAAAVNLDLTDEGRLRRRVGRRKIYNGTVRSVWSNGRLTLFAEANQLKRLIKLSDGTYTTSTLYTGLNGSSPIAYLRALGQVFLTDGQALVRIDPSDVVRSWALPPPAVGPTATVSGNGSLEAGDYVFFYTYRTASGEESAPSSELTLTLSAGSRVLLNNIPVPNDPIYTTVGIYGTAAFGSSVLLAAVPVGVSSFMYSSPVRSGAHGGFDLENLAPMLGGHGLAYYKGRIWVARDNYVIYTEAMRYGLYRPATNFMIFPERIKMIGASEGALFIVSDHTYAITGGQPGDFTQAVVQASGAPEAQPVYAPMSLFSDEPGGQGTGVLWLGHDGMMLGTPQGSVMNLTEKDIAVPFYERAAMLFREEQGVSQVLAAAPKTNNANSLKFTASFEAEVRRNGVVV